MRLDITVDYNVPADEFEELILKYPLGQYLEGGHSRWFRLEIIGDNNFISLTWFREWK